MFKHLFALLLLVTCAKGILIPTMTTSRVACRDRVRGVDDPRAQARTAQPATHPVLFVKGGTALMTIYTLYFTNHAFPQSVQYCQTSCSYDGSIKGTVSADPICQVSVCAANE
jgi:hypothetical protein